MTALVIRADARQLPLPDASVDLIVTSPPYWGQRSYTDDGEHYDGQIGSEPTPAGWLQEMLDCTREWMRVLKPTGSLWVNLGDKYSARADASRGVTCRSDRADALQPGRSTIADAPRKSLIGLPWRYAIRCVDDLGLTLRAELIWQKPNGLPESVTDRVRRTHETWFHFTLGPAYFAAIDDIRIRHAGADLSRVARGLGYKRTTVGDEGGSDRTTNTRGTNREAHPLGALPASVWEVPIEKLTVPAELGVDHFAAFPTEWPRRLIKGWSPVGGLVVDPFGGTGTTALVADALGRQGLTVDRSADYCRIARWRTTDPAQRAKALGVDKPPVELPGQASLLDLVAVAA